MIDLAVDVRRLAVRIPRGPRAPLQAELFLPPPDPRGPAGLLGRLNDRDAFVPVSAEGSILLLSKASLPLLECAGPMPELADLDEVAAERIRLLVRLRDGTEVVGTVRAVLPVDRRRLLDFLNHPDRFFAMESDTGIVVVNKAWIESVEPRETP